MREYTGRSRIKFFGTGRLQVECWTERNSQRWWEEVLCELQYTFYHKYTLPMKCNCKYTNNLILSFTSYYSFITQRVIIFIPINISNALSSSWNSVEKSFKVANNLSYNIHSSYWFKIKWFIRPPFYILQTKKTFSFYLYVTVKTVTHITKLWYENIRNFTCISGILCFVYENPVLQKNLNLLWVTQEIPLCNMSSSINYTVDWLESQQESQPKQYRIEFVFILFIENDFTKQSQCHQVRVT